MHLALRPQHHWTDQKRHVHVFTRILGYLLARTLFLRAQRAAVPYASMESLLDALTQIRRVTVARSATGKGRMRISRQLEDIDTPLVGILPALGVTERHGVVVVYGRKLKTPTLTAGWPHLACRPGKLTLGDRSVPRTF